MIDNVRPASWLTHYSGWQQKAGSIEVRFNLGKPAAEAIEAYQAVFLAQSDLIRMKTVFCFRPACWKMPLRHPDTQHGKPWEDHALAQNGGASTNRKPA